MSSPRSIKRSAGKRCRVVLGNKGSDYVFISNNDDGSKKWQNQVWNKTKGISNGLIHQIKSCVNHNIDIESFSFVPDNKWFVKGVKRDGSGPQFFWGGLPGSFGSTIKDRKRSVTSASIGDNGRWLVVMGKSRYRYSGNLNIGLRDRLKRINKEKKEINFVRLLPFNGYVISDSNGLKWCNLKNEDLERELKRVCSDPVTDVAIARNNTWIVLRENSYMTSTDISTKLTEYIRDFYNGHNARVEEEKIMKEKEVKEEQERLVKEEAKRRDAIKRKLVDDRKYEILRKGLIVGDHVTALGFSKKSGDAVVKSVGNEGIITVKREGKVTNVFPDRVVIPRDYVKDAPSEFLLLFMARDKYEAAVSMYHCLCDETSCVCAKIATANLFLPKNLRSQDPITAGKRVYVKGLAFGTVVDSAQSSFLYGRKSDLVQIKYDNDAQKIHHVHRDQLQLQYISACPVHHSGSTDTTNNNVRPFDLYKCVEKININNLHKIKLDVARDSVQRAQLAEQMMDPEKASQYDPTSRKKLLRCCELEALVNALYEYVKDLPRDQSNQNFVEYEVEYEHKDSSGRGRMFTKGLYVKQMSSESYPRTLTLQGMHKELRAPLIGEFAHDIDCVNCEVALLCSLAMQMNLKDLVPTLFEYRDSRKEWIQRISTFHDVAESDAKLLSTIIINGGRYETWKKNVGILEKNNVNNNSKTTNKKDDGKRIINNFIFSLRSEVDALRDKALAHPQFKWTLVEREKINEQRGINRKAQDMLLLPRIIQYCENEVLTIIHRCFFDAKWIVRAKVFDGLIVERSPDATTSLENMIHVAKSACKSQGWCIDLIEKPLFGKQNDALESIREAREVMSTYHKLQIPLQLTKTHPPRKNCGSTSQNINEKEKGFYGDDDTSSSSESDCDDEFESESGSDESSNSLYESEPESDDESDSEESISEYSSSSSSSSS